jgi:hypothetical protein
MDSGDSTWAAAPRRMASPGMPWTTELAASCAIVTPPRSRIKFERLGAIRAHAREQDGGGMLSIGCGDRTEQVRNRGPQSVFWGRSIEQDTVRAVDAHVESAGRHIDVTG